MELILRPRALFLSLNFCGRYSDLPYPWLTVAGQLQTSTGFLCHKSTAKVQVFLDTTKLKAKKNPSPYEDTMYKSQSLNLHKTLD